MHTKTLVVAMFLCAMGLNAAIASAQVPNLVENPSLETVNGSLPQGWTKGVYGTTQATFTYPSTGGHSGTRFVTTQITTSGTGDAKWVPTPIAVTPGVSYTFSDWYQSTAPTQVNLEYTLTTGSKSNKLIGSPTASATWKQFQATFTVPANAASVKIFHLISAVGTLSVDDYSLTSNATTTPPTPFDFALSNGGTTSLAQGESKANTVVATLVSGSTTPVTFSASGMPAGVTASFSAATCSPTCSSTLTLLASASAAVGSSTITVTATAGSVVKTSSFVLIVTAPIDTVSPSVAVNQALNQVDPATTMPILFDVIFSEPVADFDASDVTLSGTAPGTPNAVVSGSGTTYTVAVSGLTAAGTVSVAIAANAAHDSAGNGNNAATSNDATVTYNPFVPPPSPPPAITLSPATLPNGTTTISYNRALVASTTAPGPFTWTVSSGALPSGLTLGTSNSLTNAITGTPTATGTTNFTVAITNGVSSTTRAYSITITQMPATPAPQNLVSNGDFELANGTNPQNWKSSGWGTRTASFVYPAPGKSGNGAKINVTSYTSGDSKWLYPHVTIAPNTIYLYNEDYSATVGTAINIEYKMSNGSLVYKWLASPGATTGWNNASFTIVPPAGAVSFTVFHLISAVGTLSIDNVSLVGVVPQQSTNLIQNGDLEIPNGANPYNWSPNFLGTNTRVFTYPVTGKNGGKAMQVQITNFTDGSAKWISNPIDVSGHTFYSYSEDYKSDVPTNITVSYKKTDGTYEYEWLGNVPGSADWTHYSTHLSVPSDTVSLTIQHALVSVGTLAVDNVDLEAQSNDAFASGMVSITFDDGFISQYQNALPILQAAGYKAGFYIITSYPGSIRPGYMNWDQIRTLAGAGHEIGSHTRTHPRLTTLSPSQLQSEIAGSKADLVAQSVGSDTFVYPNADMSPAVINAVKDAGYVAARGGNFGLESTLADKHNLSSIHPDAYSTLPVIKQDIDQALADKRWLILVFHDVVTSGGTGNAVTPAFLQGVVDYLKQKNVPVVTLSEGASQLAQ